MRVLAASVCVAEPECGDEADLCALYVCDGYAADKVCVECDTGYFVAVAFEGVWVALSRIGVWLGFGIGFGLGELGIGEVDGWDWVEEGEGYGYGCGMGEYGEGMEWTGMR